MRKLLAVTILVALGSVTAGAATAGPPAFDKTEGAGTYLRAGCTVLGPEPFCFPTTPLVERRFSFTALQRGFGERATGMYRQERRTLPDTVFTSQFAGRVTCLNVLANTAVFGGIITEAPGAEDAVGVPFVIWIVDNGNASDGDPPDLISPLAIYPEGDPDLPLLPPAFPNICPQPFPSLYGYLPLNSGNIVVEDESPPGVTTTG